MYVKCYESWAPMEVQEQVWRVLHNKGWLSTTPILAINRFYIPEHLEAWCLLIDSNMRRIPSEDWIV